MEYVIIVAGGKGLRMGGDIPKQFLPLNGRPVLMHTLERFRAYSADLRIILVLPHEQQAYWQELCQKHAFAVEHTVVDGGETRYHSSMNGLAAIPLTDNQLYDSGISYSSPMSTRQSPFFGWNEILSSSTWKAPSFVRMPTGM